MPETDLRRRERTTGVQGTRVTGPPLLALWLTRALMLVGALACSVTFFVPSVLSGTPVMNGSARGTALTFLLVALPCTAIGMRWARAGSSKGFVVWMGGTAYCAYNAFMFCFATPFNQLFLLYVAMLALASWSLAALFWSLAGRPLTTRVGSPPGRRVHLGDRRPQRSRLATNDRAGTWKRSAHRLSRRHRPDNQPSVRPGPRLLAPRDGRRRPAAVAGTPMGTADRLRRTGLLAARVRWRGVRPVVWSQSRPDVDSDLQRGRRHVRRALRCWTGTDMGAAPQGVRRVTSTRRICRVSAIDRLRPTETVTWGRWSLMAVTGSTVPESDLTRPWRKGPGRSA
jgi:hypothetical protein